MVIGEVSGNPLSRYVPRFLVEWLRDTPATLHRTVTGTCVFADLSGYTAMTERLAAQGTAGAEETGEILNDIFEALLSAAYDFGAGLVKWGGDAVLLLFEGQDHAIRATRAAWVMQNTIARVGKVTTSRGPMRVRMSVGIHTGEFHFILAGRTFLDLVVAGPGMTTTARMEAAADAGDVVLSSATAAILEAGTTKPQGDDRHLLLEPPDAPLLPRHSALEAGVNLGQLFDPVLRDHLMTSRGEYEHRAVTAAFVVFEGTDGVLERHGPEALFKAVDDIVSRIQNVAAEHGVVLLTTDLAQNGGKALLVSGVPNKPGDDATRVLNAVVAVVAAESPFALRAGVTSGRVFAGDFGAPFRGTYSVAGDAINLAARLAYRAHTGEVLTTPDVVERSDGSFVAHALPPFSVKGKRDSIRAVSVSRRPTIPDAVHDQLPLIGRESELATLLAREQVATDGHGGVVDIIGQAGIGKSRLLAEYETKANLPIIRADGDPYAPTRPYAAAQRLMRAALNINRTSEASDFANALHEAVGTHAPHLAPWQPLLAIVAGTVSATTAEVDALDSTARAERLRRVTSEFLGALLTEPIALIFNDTHAMDDASVALLRQLATDVRKRPWSIVVARRPEGTELALPHSISLALASLSHDDADALVIAASPVAIPAARRAQLAERSGGNPLFLLALAETVAAGGNPDELPSEIEDVLTAHMDRLTPDERAWLRTAAVLGTRVNPEVLAEIADEPFDLTDSPRLAEYIRPQADGTLVFAHDLIQRTAYEALPFRRRRTLHARASYAIERRADGDLDRAADVLAVHCLRGERFDAAWQYARRAGEVARKSYALSEAAASLDIALEAADSIPGLPKREIAATAEDLASARFELGQSEETERALSRARRNSRNEPVRLARLELLTARLRHRDGRHTEAIRWISRARALLDANSGDELRLLAELAEAASVFHQTRGAMRKYREWAEIAAAEAQRCGDHQRAASALSQLAFAKAQAGEPWQAVDMSNSTTWDPATLGVITNRLGGVAYFKGDLSGAADLYATAEELSRRAGHESKAAVYLANRAEVLIDQGHLDEALSVLNRALDELHSSHAAAYVPFALLLRGRALHRLHGAAAARPAFELAAEAAREMGDTEVLAEATGCLEASGN